MIYIQCPERPTFNTGQYSRYDINWTSSPGIHVYTRTTCNTGSCYMAL